jgi:hypothetical protein
VALLADLAAQLGRLADRLRSLSDVRLAGRLPSGESRADAAHGLAQLLADSAADLAGEPRRTVPRLADLVVADQVGVTGTDLVAALVAATAAGAGGQQGGAGSGPEVNEVAEVALAAVRSLRDQV